MRMRLTSAFSAPVQWVVLRSVSLSACDQTLRYGSLVTSGTAGGRNGGPARSRRSSSRSQHNDPAWIARCFRSRANPFLNIFPPPGRPHSCQLTNGGTHDPNGCEPPFKTRNVVRLLACRRTSYDHVHAKQNLPSIAADRRTARLE